MTKVVLTIAMTPFALLTVIFGLRWFVALIQRNTGVPDWLLKGFPELETQNAKRDGRIALGLGVVTVILMVMLLLP